MTQELIDTIRNDLTDTAYPFSKMNFYFQYIHGGSNLAPHKDSPRNMSFLYMIYQNVGHTHFYQDLTNDPTRVLFDVNDYRGPVQTFQMKQYHWYVMKHDVIHGVSKIDQPRLQIVGHFSKDYHYEDWIQQYDNLLDKSFDNFNYHHIETYSGHIS